MMIILVAWSWTWCDTCLCLVVASLGLNLHECIRRGVRVLFRQSIRQYSLCSSFLGELWNAMGYLSINTQLLFYLSIHYHSLYLSCWFDVADEVVCKSFFSFHLSIYKRQGQGKWVGISIIINCPCTCLCVRTYINVHMSLSVWSNFSFCKEY